MAMLKFLKVSCLPDPKGSLSGTIPFRAIRHKRIGKFNSGIPTVRIEWLCSTVSVCHK